MTDPTTRSAPVRLGLVGYGAGGRRFQAPFVDAARDVELAGVVVRDPARRAAAQEDHPGVPVYDSLADLVAGERAGRGLDAVTITTPPATRRELVLEAIALGVHVVADKPFAPDAATAVELRDAAARAGLVLAAFHNRRWDADVRTLRDLLADAALGRVERFHSRFDLDEPGSLDGGLGGGLLRDLGSHLVDQALWLFGPVDRVYARLDEADSPEGPTDQGFVLVLEHTNGVGSFLSASKLNRIADRELRVYGERGSFKSHASDVQAAEISAGRRPADDPAAWGFEPAEHWGRLSNDEGTRLVPSSQGSYVDYYDAFARAVRGDGPAPVTADDAVAVLRVLDAARTSHESGEAVRPG